MKPENILIDGKGHLKLTDFGLSQSRIEVQHRKWIQTYFKGKSGENTHVSDDRTPPSAAPNTVGDKKAHSPVRGSNVFGAKKKRFVGTPHYLAPEVITEQKASFAADWWAVGVILFEMMTGGPPFNGNTPEEIFEHILHNERDVELNIGRNEDQISPSAAALINGLLTPEPDKRLGRGGAEEVKTHPFFQGVKWDKLRNEEPPFVPSPAGMTDTSYFSEKKQFKVADIEPVAKKARPAVCLHVWNRWVD